MNIFSGLLCNYELIFSNGCLPLKLICTKFYKINMMKWNKKIIDKAGELLQKQKKTLAVAESVTAGNLQAAFSLAKNATLFFQGGITAYNIGQKCRHLLVEPTHAIEFNCVSKKVSEQMAQEVCNLFSADYGIGITGYASPVPEQNIKQLFAFVAISKNNKTILSKKINAPKMEPAASQLYFTHRAIGLLNTVLKNR